MARQTFYGDDSANFLDLSGLADPADVFVFGWHDTVIGSAFDDLIEGGNGNDTINGGGGNDTINGGSDKDRLNGDEGDDVFLFSGQNNGFDLVNGGTGYDRILGSGGDDTIGFRRFNAGETVEEIDGLGGTNVIAGDDFANSFDFTNTVLLNIDRIDGGGGRDRITGSAGDDMLVGGFGDDRLTGGFGYDSAVFSGSHGDYSITIDSASLTVVDLNPGDGDEGSDTLIDIERLIFDDQTILLAPLPNQSPVLQADTASTDEDMAVTVLSTYLLSNDSDPDGDAFTLTGVGNAFGGTVALDTGNNVVFTPTPDFNGNASFDYTATDSNGASSTAAVTVAVAPVNDDPTALADTATTSIDTPLTLLANDLLANDGDIDGDTVTLTGVDNTAAVGGMATLDTGGNVVFTPNAGFSGAATFDYTIGDGNNASASATVTVDVVIPNDPPDLMADTASTDEDMAVTVLSTYLLSNDSDPDGDAFTLTGVGNAFGGTVALDTGNNVVFTPTPDFNGNASFDYTATDSNGASSTAAVTVAVAPVNDDPTALADTATTSIDTPLTLLANDLLANDGDIDGDTVTLTGVDNTAAVGGMATLDTGGNVVFTPNAGFSGAATFDYTIGDGNNASASATVTVTVETPSPDFITLVTDIRSHSILQWDGKSGGFLDEFTDNAIGLRNPHSIVNGPDGNIYVAWSGNSSQEPSVHAYAQDGAHLGEYASLAGLSAYPSDWLSAMTFGPDGELYVLDKGTGYGQAEIFRFDASGAFIDEYIGIAEYERPDRRLKTFDMETGPDGNLYFGNEGLHEILRFQTPSGDTLNNFGEIFASAFVITDPPLNVPDHIAANDGWSFNDETRVKPWGLDWGADGLLYVAADMAPPTGFTTMRISRFDADGNYVDDFVSLSDGYQDGVRDLDFGPDGNLYLINQDTDEILVFGDPLGPNAGQLLDTLEASGDASSHKFTSVEFILDTSPPVLQADTASTDEDMAVTVLSTYLLSNDSDPDGDAFTLTGVGNAFGGTVALDTGNNVVFTPTPDFNGNASFDYTATDSNGASSTAAVTVAVAPVNDDPTALADTATTSIDTPLTLLANDLLANDGDIDGDTVTLTGVDNTAAVGGMATLDTGGNVVFTPNAGFSGAATFDYTIGDGNNASASATVTVDVVIPNDPPDLMADTASTDEDMAVTVLSTYLLSNDSDPDGDAFTLTGVGNAFGGTVALDTGNNVVFTPTPDFNGNASFDYTATDSNGASSTAAVTVAVAPVNDDPTALADTATTSIDTPLTLLANDLLANDGDIDGDTVTLTGVDNTAAVGGMATLDTGGNVVFTPNAGFSGAATFDYTIGDGNNASASATVTVTVETPSPDFITLVTDIRSHSILQWDGKSGGFLDEFTDNAIGLRNPHSIVNGPDGNIYVAWSGNSSQEPSVHAYAQDGAHLGEYASLAGLSAYPSDWLSAMTFGPDGELYVLDKGTGYGQAEIFRFDASGAFIDEYIGIAEYERPDRRLKTFDMETGPDGNLYFGNEGLHEILRFQTPSGDTLNNFGEIFASAFVITDPPLNVPDHIAANDGWSFNDETRVKPWGLDWGADGLLYVAADMAPPTGFTTMRISRFDADGNYVDDFVSLSDGYQDGVRDLDFGPDGNLYLINQDTDEILVFGDPLGPNAGQLLDTLEASGDASSHKFTSVEFIPQDEMPVSPFQDDVT